MFQVCDLHVCVFGVALDVVIQEIMFSDSLSVLGDRYGQRAVSRAVSRVDKRQEMYVAFSKTMWYNVIYAHGNALSIPS